MITRLCFVVSILVGMFLTTNGQDTIHTSASKFDFSTALASDENWQNGTGFISKKRTILKMYFVNVIRNHNNSFEYFVYGKSKVKTNVTPFAGIIRMDSVFEFLSDSGIILKAYWNFEFSENPYGKHTGFFVGKGEALFGVSEPRFNGSPLIKVSKISQTNRSFKGSWTTHDRRLALPCEWSDEGMMEQKRSNPGAVNSGQANGDNPMNNEIWW